MTSIHNKINELWDAAGHDITKPPHLQGIEDEARRLDLQLSEAIRPYFTQWNEGLISSVELMNHLMIEASKEA